MFSKRITTAYLGAEDFLLRNLATANSDSFDIDSNPNGYVNLGTSVNALHEDEIQEWITKNGIEHRTEWQHYYDFSGHSNVREIVAEFLTERLKVAIRLDPQNIVLQAGVTTLLESLAFALGDPGDTFIIPFPTYPRFKSDIYERAQIQLKGPVLRAENGFKLSPNLVDEYITALKQNGEFVKGYLHCNPNNPLGDVYSKAETMELMKVCAKHEIHFISDEIYALSIHDESTKFESILTIENLPDPLRTHFIWGMSKDFGLASFRFGVIHTLNQDLLKVMNGMCLYTGTQGHIQQIGAKILSDRQWLDTFYFPQNIRKLREAFEDCRRFFESFGCKVHPCKAGLFAWIDFAPFFALSNLAISPATEKEMFFKLLNEHKLYIPNGTEFGCENPGWFRIIFSIRREHWDEFKLRFARFVNNLKN